MSRAYRISLSERLRKHVRVEDGLELQLEVLEVLDRESIGELLSQELLARGYRERDGQLERRTGDGVVARIDVEARKVHVGLEAEHEIELERSGQARAYDDAPDGGGGARDRLRSHLRSQLEHDADAEAQSLRGELTARLEQALADLRAGFDEVTRKVSAEALKRRAAQLGEVQEIDEDEQTGSLTIRVKL